MEIMTKRALKNLVTANLILWSLVFLSPNVYATEMFGPQSIGDGVVDSYNLTPDGSKVVYSIGNTLFVSSVDGGVAIELAQVDEGIIENIKISADGEHIVFESLYSFITFDAGEENTREFGFHEAIHGVSIEGQGFVTYADTRPFERFGFGRSNTQNFEISPDSNRVVFLLPPRGQSNRAPFFLSSQAIDGGDEFVYNRNQFGTAPSSSFEFSPDGSNVVFISSNTDSSDVGVFRAPTSGGGRVRLSDSSQAIAFGDPTISPDSNVFVFSANPVGEASAGVFAVPLVGGAQVQLNDEAIGNATSPLISPDGTYVVYRSSNDLYRVSISGGTSIKLNLGASDTGAVSNINFTPDSERVVFTAGGSSRGETRDLYSVASTGGVVEMLNAPLDPEGRNTVTAFKISPDSSYVTYFAAHSSNGTRNFYSVPTSGGDPIQLSDAILINDFDTPDFQISPDSRRVVYHGNLTSGNKNELFSVLKDGSQRTPLSNDVGQFLINSTSTRVVLARSRLVSVGIDGASNSDLTCFVVKTEASKVVPICF